MTYVGYLINKLLRKWYGFSHFRHGLALFAYAQYAPSSYQTWYISSYCSMVANGEKTSTIAFCLKVLLWTMQNTIKQRKEVGKDYVKEKSGRPPSVSNPKVRNIIKRIIQNDGINWISCLRVWIFLLKVSRILLKTFFDFVVIIFILSNIYQKMPEKETNEMQEDAPNFHGAPEKAFKGCFFLFRLSIFICCTFIFF